LLDVNYTINPSLLHDIGCENLESQLQLQRQSFAIQAYLEDFYKRR